MIISVEEETRHHKHQQKLPPTVVYDVFANAQPIVKVKEVKSVERARISHTVAASDRFFFFFLTKK